MRARVLAAALNELDQGTARHAATFCPAIKTQQISVFTERRGMGGESVKFAGYYRA